MSPAPWYKERLSSKCFREYSCKKERYSDALNTQRWRFLKSGLDDFRTGRPPPSDHIIIHGKKGPVPVILRYKKTDPSQMIPYKPWELRSKKDVSFSKLSDSQKIRKDYITQAEGCLAQHPLALYPHLEESVSPELFRELVRLLDPEMHQSRSSQDHLRSKVTLPTLQYQAEDGITTETRHGSANQFWKPQSRNPYMWLNKKESDAREEACRIDYIPPLDDNIKQITKEFCDWINAMGGEQYDIDEATILKLFDTHYETKAALSAPIKIVELYHVPAELKQCLGRPPPQAVSKVPSEPKCEKIRYGAWYLPPRKWKKQSAKEESAVPDILQNFLKSRNYGKKVEEAKPLHGIYAFEEFLELKGYRKPADKDQRRTSQTPKENAKRKSTLTSAANRNKLLDDKITEFKTVWFPYIHFEEENSPDSHCK